MSVTVPPRNFDPHVASQDELRRYGFPARPASGSALATWNRMYPYHHIDYVAPKMCSAENGVRHLPPRTKVLRSGTAPSETTPNWSGGLAQQQSGQAGFTFAAVQWTEPSFKAACPTASGYSIWSGLGGFVNGRSKWGLLQAGADNIGGNGPNDDYPFWEALNQNNAQTLPEQIITNFKLSPGNKVQAVTYYRPSDHTVAFQFYNLTTNKLTELGPWKAISAQDGTPLGITDDYYDGTTAELIAERPSVGGKPINLRQPSAPRGQAHRSVFNSTAIGNDNDGDAYPGAAFPGWESLTMVGATNNVLSEPTGFPTDPNASSTGWNNTWEHCS